MSDVGERVGLQLTGYDLRWQLDSRCTRKDLTATMLYLVFFPQNIVEVLYGESKRNRCTFPGSGVAGSAEKANTPYEPLWAMIVRSDHHNNNWFCDVAEFLVPSDMPALFRTSTAAAKLGRTEERCWAWLAEFVFRESRACKNFALVQWCSMFHGTLRPPDIVHVLQLWGEPRRAARLPAAVVWLLTATNAASLGWETGTITTGRASRDVASHLEVQRAQTFGGYLTRETANAEIETHGDLAGTSFSGSNLFTLRLVYRAQYASDDSYIIEGELTFPAKSKFAVSAVKWCFASSGWPPRFCSDADGYGAQRGYDRELIDPKSLVILLSLLGSVLCTGHRLRMYRLLDLINVIMDMD